LAEQADPQLLISFQEYLVRQGMSPATVKNYLADLRVFARWYDAHREDGVSLLAFSAAELRTYRTEMSSNGLSPSSVNRRLQALRKFGQYAVESGLLPHNPAQDVARLRTERSSPPCALAAGEADALLEAVLAEAKPSQVQRDYAIVLTLASCGVRLREVVDLRLEDVELGVDEGYVMIGPSAAEGGRVIPFGAATAAALKAYLRVRPNVPGVDYFFLNREGRPISQRTVQRLVARYAQAADLENVSPQTLRTTFAHAMFEGTKDMKIVAQLMGHRSTAVTARYFE
jgi:site-specific recombinase XerD